MKTHLHDGHLRWSVSSQHVRRSIFTSAPAASILLALCIASVVPGRLRVVVALAAGIVSYIFIRRLPAARDANMRAAAQADAALLCAAAAATIRAGGDEVDVAQVCSQVAQQPLAEVFAAAAAAISAGVSPQDAWVGIGRQVPQLQVLSSAMAHAAERGVGAVASVNASQRMLERESNRHQASRIKRAGVHALLPLGLLGLPGFLLLTVVPLVAAYASAMQWL